MPPLALAVFRPEIVALPLLDAFRRQRSGQRQRRADADARPGRTRRSSLPVRQRELDAVISCDTLNFRPIMMLTVSWVVANSVVAVAARHPASGPAPAAPTGDLLRWRAGSANSGITCEANSRMEFCASRTSMVPKLICSEACSNLPMEPKTRADDRLDLVRSSDPSAARFDLALEGERAQPPHRSCRSRDSPSSGARGPVAGGFVEGAEILLERTRARCRARVARPRGRTCGTRPSPRHRRDGRPRAKLAGNARERPDRPDRDRHQ